MSSKLDVRRVITDHLDTLRPSDGQEPLYFDIATFYAVPATAATFFLLVVGDVSADMARQVDSVLVAAFAIFAALLLNVQVLIIGLSSGKSAREEGPISRENAVLENRLRSKTAEAIAELFANVSYAILVAVVSVVATVVAMFVKFDTSIVVKSIQLFCLVHFSLTLLMVLKRMHVVFFSTLRG